MTIHDLDDNENNILIQLQHFKNRNRAVHFKLISGEWRNAIIKYFEDKRVYIKEFVLGELDYALSDIDSNSIAEYISKEMNKNA